MICQFWSSRNGVADNSVLLGCDAASMYNVIPTFRGKLWFSSSRIQVAVEDSTVPDVSKQLVIVFQRKFFGLFGCWIRGNYAVLKRRCRLPSDAASHVSHKNWILKQWYVSWTPLAEWTSEDTCNIFNVQRSVHRKFISFDIFPTRCNFTQFIYFWKTALHVSGGISTHHQEYKQLYLQ